MKYEKPMLEEMELILEGPCLCESTGLGIGGEAEGNDPWA